MSKTCMLWNATQPKSKLVKKRRHSSPLMSVETFGRESSILGIGNTGFLGSGFLGLSEVGLHDTEFLVIEIYTLIGNSREVNDFVSQFLCLQHIILCTERKILR